MQLLDQMIIQDASNFQPQLTVQVALLSGCESTALAKLELA